jgi:hypothetical protein
MFLAIATSVVSSPTSKGTPKLSSKMLIEPTNMCTNFSKMNLLIYSWIWKMEKNSRYSLKIALALRQS